MSEKITLLDGAVGTSLWEKTDKQVPVWRYNVEDPGIVKELHKEYLEAGAEIILANTFGANALSMAKTDYKVKDIIPPAMDLIHEAVGDKAKIALAVGPLTQLLEPYGDLTEEEAYELFDEQISIGVEGAPDLISIQTFMDVEMMKVAAKAARKHNLPITCSMSFEKVGKTIMGNSVQDMIDGLAEFHPDAIGLNCSLGPDMAVPIMKEFSEKTDIPLYFKPNAGKPTVSGDGTVQKGFDIDTFVNDVVKAIPYGVRYIGGCCGTNAAYIKALKEKLDTIR